MMLVWYASVVVGYGRRRSGLCNAAINRKHDNYSWHRDIAIALNLVIQHNSYPHIHIFTYSHIHIFTYSHILAHILAHIHIFT